MQFHTLTNAYQAGMHLLDIQKILQVTYRGGSEKVG
jgi:hypothetical protein